MCWLGTFVVDDAPETRVIPRTPTAKQVTISKNDGRLGLDVVLRHVLVDTSNICTAAAFDFGARDNRSQFMLFVNLSAAQFSIPLDDVYAGLIDRL